MQERIIQEKNPFTGIIVVLVIGWILLTMFWVGALVALPASMMGRVKLQFTPAPENPPGTYHVIYGSTNASHMTVDRKMLAPLKVFVVGTNTVALSNLVATTWYFMCEARYSNQVSLPSPSLQVWLLAPPKGVTLKDAFPKASVGPVE